MCTLIEFVLARYITYDDHNLYKNLKENTGIHSKLKCNSHTRQTDNSGCKAISNVWENNDDRPPEKLTTINSLVAHRSL